VNAALLTLVQWLSPAFPTGGFAYSHGIEAAVVQGQIRRAADLQGWLRDVLRFGAGRQDAILLAAGLRPGADFQALDDLARALQPSSERLAETLDQGAALARTVTAICGDMLPTPVLPAPLLPARALPVAFAEAVATLLPGGGRPDPAQVIALYLHGFVSNLVSGAVRFIPLGQTEGQGVLARLHPDIIALAAAVVDATPDDIGGAAFGADLAAMAHETLEVRIFRT
jgi:urease accessory protein